MHVVSHVPHYLVYNTTLPFHSFHLAQVSECRFSDPISYLTSQPLIHLVELDNPISYGHAMSF